MVLRKRKLSVEIKSNVGNTCLTIFFIDKFKYNENTKAKNTAWLRNTTFIMTSLSVRKVFLTYCPVFCEGRREKMTEWLWSQIGFSFTCTHHKDHQYFMCNMKAKETLLCMCFVINYPGDREIYMIWQEEKYSSHLS